MRLSLAVKLTVVVACCAVLLAAGTPILDPAPHSVDLRPALPILAGVVAIFVIWTAAFARWIIREIRRD